MLIGFERDRYDLNNSHNLQNHQINIYYCLNIARIKKHPKPESVKFVTVKITTVKITIYSHFALSVGTDNYRNEYDTHLLGKSISGGVGF